MTKKKRYKIVCGGRGSGKSQTFADIFLHLAAQNKLKIGCFREYQNSIEDSVYSLLSDEITRIDIPGFSRTKTSIDHESGGGFRFKGLARGLEGVKSSHGFNIFWVEEAQFLSEPSINILTPTLREEGSELWMSLNPGSSADPVSKRFLNPYWQTLLQDGYYEDDLHLIIMVNYDDNPFFPAVLEAERQHDLLTLPRALYDHIWEGHFNDSVDNSIIQAEWFDSAIDAHKKLGFEPVGIEVVAHDPSDLGPDDKGLAHRHGSVVLDVQSKSTGDVNDGCDWALDYALNNHVDLFTWDCDGMGVSLNRQVSKSLDGKHIDYVMYRGSESPENPGDVYQGDQEDKKKRKTNRETFKNKRAQFAWMLRDRFFNTYLAVVKGQYKDPDSLISISSDIKEIDNLRSETCRIPRKHNGNGMIQIMTKMEMKNKLKIESPNLFDSLCMCFVTKEKEDEFEDFEFSGWG